MRARRQALNEPFPDGWRKLLSADNLHWRHLPPASRLRMEDLIRYVVADTTWEGVDGLEVTDEVRVRIAADACLLVLGLDLALYKDVTSVIVVPEVALRTGERHLGGGIYTDDPIHLSGEARQHGPVMIAWSEYARSAVTGRNVVHHEFAHKLDMASSRADGVPPIDDPVKRRRFEAVCDGELARMRAGVDPGVLDPYGATNRVEFFAVATEAFFARPGRMADELPSVFDVLAEFYRQDPAARLARGGVGS